MSVLTRKRGTPAPRAMTPVMARATALIEPPAAPVDREAIRAERRRLEELSRGLFGCERRALNQLRRQARELEKEETRDELRGYRRLSSEVLDWRREDGMPELALFSLDSPTLTLTVEWGGRWDPELPSFAVPHYEDVVARLLRRVDHVMRYRYQCQATFDGVIPAATRTRIREALKSGKFEEVRLLAETDWKVTATPVPFDPIVVGIAAERMHVIDVFDPTPVEEYAATEFAV